MEMRNKTKRETDAPSKECWQKSKTIRSFALPLLLLLPFDYRVISLDFFQILIHSLPRSFVHSFGVLEAASAFKTITRK